MTESNETPSSDANDRDPTTVSTRVWAANEIAKACDMLVEQPALLTPDLVGHARMFGPKDGGMPRWLVHGLAARHFRQWLEQRVVELSEQAITEAREAARVPTKEKDGR